MNDLIAESHVVDVECMLGRGVDRLWKFEDADGLEAQMDAFGIDEAVVWHAAADTLHVREGNRMLADEIAGRDRLLACPVASPHFGTSEMPEADAFRAELAATRPAAVRLLPGPDTYPLHPFYAGELLEILNEFRLPALVRWESVDPVHFARVTADFPNVPFVLLKAGFRRSRLLYPLLRRRENVFVTCSDFVDTNLIEGIASRFGAERILFGTDMPKMHPGPAIALVCYADLADADKQAILGGNWRRIREGVRWP